MPAKKTGDKPTFADIKRRKRPNTQSVSIVLDPSINRQIEELNRQYMAERRRDTRENRPPVAPTIATEIETLQAQADDDTVEFVFTDIGRARFEALIEGFPPTELQLEKWGENLQWDPDLFGPAIVKAACTEPKLTKTDVDHIFKDWGTGDVQRLFAAAVAVCMESASVPFTRSVIDEMLSSDLNSITVPNEESPTLGSLVDDTDGTTTTEQN